MSHRWCRYSIKHKARHATFEITVQDEDGRIQGPLDMCKPCAKDFVKTTRHLILKMDLVPNEYRDIKVKFVDGR